MADNRKLTVVIATTSVTTATLVELRAGQLVTEAAQLVIVRREVIETVKVVCGPVGVAEVRTPAVVLTAELAETLAMAEALD